VLDNFSPHLGEKCDWAADNNAELPTHRSPAPGQTASKRSRQLRPDAAILTVNSEIAPPSRRDLDSAYLIWSYTLNSGRYIAITMKPTMPPTKTIITGSRIEVSALTEAETWSS
jgi:hypothetical protein